jgi:hypothetical protein
VQAVRPQRWARLLLTHWFRVRPLAPHQSHRSHPGDRIFWFSSLAVVESSAELAAGPVRAAAAAKAMTGADYLEGRSKPGPWCA